MTIQDIISSNSDTTSEFKNRITKKNIEREISLRIEDFKRSFFGNIYRHELEGERRKKYNF